MKWNVSNAISRDVERQQLNKILADIRAAIDARSSSTTDGSSIQDTVGKMVEHNSEKGIAVTYDYSAKVLDFAVSDFIIRLSGDITGEGEVVGLNTVTINTTLDPSLIGVPEAPVDNSFYWRWNGEWAQVGNSLTSLSATRGTGFAAGHQNSDGDERWTFRQFAAAAGELTLANADGATGNPVYGLADVADSGVGVSPIQLFTRDSKGRISGTEDASTTDLPEGSNLYFTDERAQDAVGTHVVGTGDVPLTYDDTSGAIGAELSASVLASLALADSAVQPARSITTTAPLTGGGDLSADRVLGISAATDSSAGAMSAADKTKVDGIAMPQDSGAAADGVTDDTTPVSSTLSAQTEVRLHGDYLITSLVNDFGADLTGPGRLLKTITGGTQQLNSEADKPRHVFGQEYLYAFHSKLLSGTSASMLFSGDSTTAGGATHATTPYLINEVVLNLGLTRGHKLTAANAGHSAKDTNDWVTTYLAADLATNPDLYVIRWGINDPYDSRSLSDFKTSLRSGLATIRASKSLAQMSILLMVPNSTSDTPNGRDEKWYEQVRRVCRQAARDYQCAFMDTYSLWQDSRHAAGLWMDDAFADGRAIHPMNVMNTWIGSEIGKLLFPEALDPQAFGTYTPTYTKEANVNTFTAYAIYWVRKANAVTVYGRVDIACTAAANTLTQLGMSLPVPTNFTVGTQLGGGGGIGQPTYQTFLCLADTTNDRARMQFLSNGTTSAAAFFQFTYLVQ